MTNTTINGLSISKQHFDAFFMPYFDLNIRGLFCFHDSSGRNGWTAESLDYFHVDFSINNDNNNR